MGRNGIPSILSMCGKYGIEGDDSIFELFQTRLTEADTGAEMYPESPEMVVRLSKYLPQKHECSLHLPRYLSILVPEDIAKILSFADAAPEQIFGMIIHDQRTFSQSMNDTCTALLQIDQQLQSIENSPLLFVEYAAMLDPEFYLEMFKGTPSRKKVFPCLDIGHLALFFCNQHFSNLNPNKIVYEFKPDSSELPGLISDIQNSCFEALEKTLEFVNRLTRIKGPLHFHLHDAHPCSALSRWLVCDHLSFLQKIRLPFPFKGSNLLSGIYGVNGLKKLLKIVLAGKNANDLSFMLEVHPQQGRTPLGPYSKLFSHWKDLTNAERANFWIDNLLTNIDLVKSSLFT